MSSFRALILCVFLPIFAQTAPPQRICVIIHGTWAREEPWSKPSGDFYTALKKQVQNASINLVSFNWSGNADAQSRAVAAKTLHKLMHSYSPGTVFSFVGHSHGANIAILACNNLAKANPNGYRIEAIYALGALICKEYLPDMSIIEYVYNLFSLNDFVQPLFGLYERVYPAHPRIANIRVILNGLQPDHSQMHDPAIAECLFCIHEKVVNGQVPCTQPLLCTCAHACEHILDTDSARENLLKQDKQLIAPLLFAALGYQKNQNQA